MVENDTLENWNLCFHLCSGKRFAFFPKIMDHHMFTGVFSK